MWIPSAVGRLWIALGQYLTSPTTTECQATDKYTKGCRPFLHLAVDKTPGLVHHEQLVEDHDVFSQDVRAPASLSCLPER